MTLHIETALTLFVRNKPKSHFLEIFAEFVVDEAETCISALAGLGLWTLLTKHRAIDIPTCYTKNDLLIEG